MKSNKFDIFYTPDRLKLWEIELSIMEDIKKICSEYSLSYFLIGGCAIGSVRHEGFIPWDDDLDIGMLRGDFDILLKVLKENYQGKYAVQYGVNDDLCSFILRVRDLNSTAIIKEQKNMNIAHGIFVEIYPFDQVPKNILIKKLQYSSIHLLSYLLHERYYSIETNFFKSIFVKAFSIFSNNQLWELIDKISRFFNNQNCKYVDTISLSQYAREGILCFSKKSCERVLDVPFENTELSVSVDNDLLLRRQYGDYMIIPDYAEIVKHHQYLIYYDPFHSYKYWKNSSIVDEFFNH